MKIVDRIPLNFEKSKPFNGSKCKNCGVFYIFFNMPVKRDAEQYDAVVEEG